MSLIANINTVYSSTVGGIAKFIAGWTGTENCGLPSASTHTIKFSKPVSFVDHTGVSFINDTTSETEAGPFTTIESSPSDLLSYNNVAWVTDPVAGDILKYRYYSVTGNYVDGPLNPAYTASIYQGSKFATAAEQTEVIATGVTGIEVQNPVGGVVTVTVDGVALIPAALSGETVFYKVSGSVLGYSRDADGAIQLGQGKYIDAGDKVEDAVLTLVNCLSPGYKSGTIYSSSKTTGIGRLTERMATGVTMVIFKDVTSDLSIGFGDTINDAEIEKEVILAGGSKGVAVTGNYISWKSLAAGTATIEQGAN